MNFCKNKLTVELIALLNATCFQIRLLNVWLSFGLFRLWHFSNFFLQFNHNEPNTINPLGLRMQSVIKEVDKIAKFSMPSIGPLMLKSPEILLDFNQDKIFKLIV